MLQNRLWSYTINIMKAVVCGLIFVALLLPSVSRADADKVYRDSSPAVVVVVAIDKEGRAESLGSGFIVREDGAVVTNYHVIHMASDIMIKTGTKVRDVEGVLYVDPENDLAIIKMEGKGYPTVRIGDAGNLRVGEKVYVVGNPHGLENTISEGIVSGIREVDATRKLLQITAAISPGSSGGPVFNDNGEVVGIATFLIADAQNLNFAIAVNLVTPGLSRKELAKPQNACQVDYRSTAACWYYEGLAWGIAGRLDKATEAFKRSLSIDSKRVDTYVNLGVTYAKAERYDDAVRMFTEALKMDSNKPDVLALLGATYGEMGKYSEALATFKSSNSFKPEATTYYNLAIVYGKMDRHAEALEAAKEAVRLKPEYADAHGYLGFEYTMQRAYNEAAAEYKKGLRINPDDTKMHFGLGSVYVLTGEKALALEEYKILKGMDQRQQKDCSVSSTSSSGYN